MMSRLVLAGLVVLLAWSVEAGAQRARKVENEASRRLERGLRPGRPTSETLPAAPAVRDVLRQRVERLDWDEISFGEVIEWLESLAPINVIVMWRALEIEGIDSNTPVSLRMRGATVATILNEVLAQLGEGGVGVEQRNVRPSLTGVVSDYVVKGPFIIVRKIERPQDSLTGHD